MEHLARARIFSPVINKTDVFPVDSGASYRAYRNFVTSPPSTCSAGVVAKIH